LIRISEIFQSVQGEGFLTGTPSIFVRTSGCNLRCWFCDTRYASWEPEGDTHSIEDILHKVDAFRGEHVVITGGEPMIFEALGELCKELKQRGKHITIETAGTLDGQVDCDLWSISPKLSNSSPIDYIGDAWVRKHEAVRYAPKVVESLMSKGDYQLKFVVGSILDAEEVLEYLSHLRGWDRHRVLLMPRGIHTEELDIQLSWLADWCKTHDLRLCDRQHIRWFGNRRGT
jgi:7-carboxy-7-deazaguanine synthase